MHLYESSLLISLIRKSECDIRNRVSKNSGKYLPNKSISSRYAGNRIQHNFSALATQERSDEFRLPVIPQAQHRVSEHSNKIRVGSLRCKIPNKNAVFLGILLLRSRNGAAHGRK